MCDLAATGADTSLLFVALLLLVAGAVALAMGGRSRAGALALILIVSGFGLVVTGSPESAQAACADPGQGGGTGGTSQTSAVIALSSSSWDAGTDTASTTLTVTNVSATTAAINVADIVTGDPDFTVTTTCAALLAPGATCALGVTYIRGVGGPRSATLTVVGTNTNTVTAALLASPPLALAISPAVLDVPTVGLFDLTVSNANLVDATNLAIALPIVMGISLVSTTCGAVLAAGASCVVTVNFAGLADATTTLTAGADGFIPAVATLIGHSAIN